MKRRFILLCPLLYLAFTRLTKSDKVTEVRDRETRLMNELFEKYHPEFLPRLNGSEQVEVKFNFELINIKEVNARDQFIAVYGWVRQTWYNPLLQWNASEYEGYDHIMVDATKVWVPDIFLYNNYDVQDRVGGGRETYKTQVSLYSDGTNIWRSPAMFNSLCDVDVTYFPFDVQSCILKFGSWSRPTSEMRTVPETIHANSTNYIENGEWQLISQTWRRNVVPYRGGRLHFDDVTLTIKIGRQYHTYFINLVIPCALISTMIFLSFLLPPECGERISLGITVLLAMTVFQQLTQQLFPSFDIPLLGQYYMATILEISMALAATTLVLNFKFRNSTRMPGWLRKLFLTRLSRLVGLKATVDKSRPKRTTRKTLRRTLYDPSDADAHDERRFVQELKDALQDSTRNHEAIDLHLNRSVNDISAKHGVFAVPPTTYGQQDSDDDVFEPSGVRDENGQEMNEDELAFRQWEWNMAANILDRFALGLSVVIGVVTFLAIFFQAPAIRAHFP